MSNLNKVILIGRLGADPEVRYTTEGSSVASFRIATTETWKDKGGNKQERTEWHSIVAWRRLGEIAGEYLKKGSLVYIEGRIRSREYDAKDGTKRKVFEIEATDMKLLPSGSGGGGSGGGASYRDQGRAPGASQQHAEPDFIPEVEDDIKY
jgi:single-strand DNA-binding protein